MLLLATLLAPIARHGARLRPRRRARPRGGPPAPGTRVPGDQRRRTADRRGEPAVRGAARGTRRAARRARRSPTRIERAGLGAARRAAGAPALGRLAAARRHRPRHRCTGPTSSSSTSRPSASIPSIGSGSGRSSTRERREHGHHDPLLHPLSRRGGAVRPGGAARPRRVSWPTTPGALERTVGDEVAEIEGPGAERLVRALRGLGAVASGPAHRARAIESASAGATRAGDGARRRRAGRRALRVPAARPSRTSTSPAHAGTRAPTAEADERAGARSTASSRRDLSRATPADQPAARRPGPPVHVAAARRHGLQRHRAASRAAVRTRRSCFPGIVVMAALFGAMLTAISTVYDREFGMLRLMLASPGRRAARCSRAARSPATLVGIAPGRRRAGCARRS